MTYEIDPQVFGGMVENIKTLLIHQSEIKNALKETNSSLFRKIDFLQDDITEIKSNGCVIGRQHSVDILALQEKPGKLVAIGAIIIGALATIGGGAIWLFNHVKL